MCSWKDHICLFVTKAILCELLNYCPLMCTTDLVIYVRSDFIASLCIMFLLHIMSLMELNSNH